MTEPTNPNQITITVGGNQIPVVQPDIQTATSKSKTDAKATSVKTDEVEAPEDTKDNSTIPQNPYRSDPLFYEVAEFFGLKEVDYDSAKNKLSDIVEFVIKDIGSSDPDKVIPKLRELEDAIQSPGWDERRYTNVHKYIRLASKKQVISKMMKAYEK